VAARVLPFYKGFALAAANFQPAESKESAQIGRSLCFWLKLTPLLCQENILSGQVAVKNRLGLTLFLEGNVSVNR
jgi:hypothetical protein